MVRNTIAPVLLVLAIVLISRSNGHDIPSDVDVILGENVDKENDWFRVDTANGRKRINLDQVSIAVAQRTTITVTNDETPDVSGALVVIVDLANTVVDTVTGFDGGETGQTLIVVGDGFTTLEDSAGLNLAGVLDVLLLSGQVVTFVHDGTTWIETSRTF